MLLPEPEQEVALMKKEWRAVDRQTRGWQMKICKDTVTFSQVSILIF